MRPLGLRGRFCETKKKAARAVPNGLVGSISAANSVSDNSTVNSHWQRVSLSSTAQILLIENRTVT